MASECLDGRRDLSDRGSRPSAFDRHEHGEHPLFAQRLDGFGGNRVPIDLGRDRSRDLRSDPLCDRSDLRGEGSNEIRHGVEIPEVIRHRSLPNRRWFTDSDASRAISQRAGSVPASLSRLSCASNTGR